MKNNTSSNQNEIEMCEVENNNQLHNFVFEVNYNLKGDEVRQGLKIFQKQTIYKKNYIYTAILVFIFLTYIISTFINPTGFNTFMILISLTVIGFIWYVPNKHIKSISDVTYNLDDIFKAYFCEDYILFGEENQTKINYFDFRLKIIETENSFLIFNSKENVFIIPFRCINQNDLPNIQHLLKQKVENRYIIKNN